MSNSYGAQKQMINDMQSLLKSLHIDLEAKKTGYRDAIQYMKAQKMMLDFIEPLETEMFPRIAAPMNELQHVLQAALQQADRMREDIESAERAAAELRNRVAQG